MSDLTGLLRNADMERLRGVALALRRGGRFVIVVAETAAWLAAKAALAAELDPAVFHEVRLITGEDVMRMFASPVVADEGIVVLHVGDDASDAIQTLNLHRDKLRLQVCRFVLRLDGAAVQERFVREAPDAYSVRDAAAFIEGWAAPVTLQPDVEKLERLRREVAETGEPRELLELANGLFEVDRPEEAHRALERGIATLESKEELSPEERSTLAKLHHHRISRGSPEEQRHHLCQALLVLEPVRGQVVELYADILGQINDAHGPQVTSARRALTLARQSVADDWHVPHQVLRLADALFFRCDVKEAREVLQEVSSHPWMSSPDRFLFAQIEAFLLMDEGRWEEAERRLRMSLAASVGSGQADWFFGLSVELAQLLCARGELESAMEILAPITNDAAESLGARIRRARAEPQAITALTAPLVAVPPGADALFEAIKKAGEDAQDIRAAIEAGLLEPSRGVRLDAEITALAAHVAVVAPTDPPWSRIKMDLLVADDLLARSSTEEGACAAAQRALSLARAGAPEMVSPCTRRIAVARLRTGHLQGLSDLFDEAFTAAGAHHLPGEAARLCSLRLWQATRSGESVAEAEQALEAAIHRTGSVLIEAEVLYQAGRGAGRPDLLERSRRIYRSLPWPAREAECLEALGRKPAALARYNAFGLRLAALALERRDRPPPIGA